VTEIQFTIPGRPKAWERAGRSGKRSYTVDRMKVKENEIAWIANAAMPKGVLFDGPIELIFAAIFAIPKRWRKAEREYAAHTPVWHVDRPDLDNLTKLIGDALNGVVWVDDEQVVRVIASKHYGPESRTDVIVRTL